MSNKNCCNRQWLSFMQFTVKVSAGEAGSRKEFFFETSENFTLPLICRPRLKTVGYAKIYRLSVFPAILHKIKNRHKDVTAYMK